MNYDDFASSGLSRPRNRQLRTEAQIMQDWGGAEQIAVSIVLVSFNQESYIEDALAGALSQKTSFPFEIILHDDASTDGTREILEKYALEYPEIIIPVLRTVNIFSKGGAPFWEGMKNTRGKYVAICEGDDFWIDDGKLAKQYSFMEANSSAAFCCHNASVHYVGTGEVKDFNTKLSSGYYSTRDLVLRKWFIPTASLFFRRDIASRRIPAWYGQVRSQDLALEIVLSLEGDLWYQNEKSSVYRKNAIGSLSAKNEVPWAHLYLRIDLFKKLRGEFPYMKRYLIWADILITRMKIAYSRVLTKMNNND